MKLSLALTTICLPTLLDMLGSITRFPDQTVCVINRVSQRKCEAIVQQNMARTEAEAREKYPFIEFLEVTDEKTWNSVNQQFNIGMKHARNDYIAIAHDDLIFADGYDYFGAFSAAIDLLPDAQRESGLRIIGLNFSAYEGGAKVISPAEMPGPLYWQPFPPTTIVVDRRAIAEAGWFDEEYGIWYDANMQTEVLLRNWYLMYLPLPVAHHHSGRSFSVTRYPLKWNTCKQNLALKYGVPSIAAKSYTVSESILNRVQEIITAHTLGGTRSPHSPQLLHA